MVFDVGKSVFLVSENYHSHGSLGPRQWPEVHCCTYIASSRTAYSQVSGTHFMSPHHNGCRPKGARFLQFMAPPYHAGKPMALKGLARRGKHGKFSFFSALGRSDGRVYLPPPLTELHTFRITAARHRSVRLQPSNSSFA